VTFAFTAGEKFGGASDETTRVALEAISLATAEEKKLIAQEKAAKKAAFDSEYDVGEIRSQTPEEQAWDGLRVCLSLDCYKAWGGCCVCTNLP
jgi:hypothetical protein